MEVVRARGPTRPARAAFPVRAPPLARVGRVERISLAQEARAAQRARRADTMEVRAAAAVLARMEAVGERTQARKGVSSACVATR